jgi:hypothetical protein
LNLRWETVVWVGVAVASPALATVLWPRLRERLGDWAELVERFAPWAHGFGPAYLALLSGAIRAREAGLLGHAPLAWVGGALACAVWLWLATFRRPGAVDWPEPNRGVLDEPRWTLYRAAGSQWVGDPQIGGLVGLALALSEWGLGGRAQGRVEWQTLARLASSSLVFALTRNFWLTALAQAGLLILLRRGRNT